MRRRPDSNRCMMVLQTIALPLGHAANFLGAVRYHEEVEASSDGKYG